jgi:hypothetical protein
LKELKINLILDYKKDNMFKGKIRKIRSVTDIVNTDDLKAITNDKNAFIKAGYTK